MQFFDGYLFGNGILHDRFCITTEILGTLMSNASRTVSNADLELATGRSGREIGKLCRSMQRAGLLQTEAKTCKGWRLGCEPSKTTLEDVLRCVLAEQQQGARSEPDPQIERGNTRHNVNLLVMQATMAINQSVFRHLSQFSLDLLKGRGGKISSYQKATAFC